eukprot:COSAG06_NODE_3568_length_5176_cov_22.718732_6_plen_88_part_00
MNVFLQSNGKCTHGPNVRIVFLSARCRTLNRGPSRDAAGVRQGRSGGAAGRAQRADRAGRQSQQAQLCSRFPDFLISASNDLTVGDS